MKTIGIIGFGNMGSCLAERLKTKYKIYVFDKDREKIAKLLQIETEQSSVDLIKKVDVIILAVKPQDFDNVLEEIKGEVQDKLVISIAAGITVGYIEKYLGSAKIIRTMPNLLIKIGKGITFIYKNKYAEKKDLEFAKNLFDSVGQIFILKDEDMMDSATAVTGSGPGYYSDLLEVNKINLNDREEVKRFNKKFIPSFVNSAQKVGFNKQEARILVKSIVLNTVGLIRKEKISAGELAKRVTSKGGTTEAAINILHKGGTLEEAVRAARDRAKELSKK